MTIGTIKSGDIIQAEVKGRVFYALVKNPTHGALEVEPLDNRITYYHVRAREVVGHWRKRKA